nr:cytosolic Fe-S cluster assembly factor narfl [Halisarca dujardinii]
MAFSSALRLTDLDDFITPSQECIKPVKMAPKKAKTSAIKIDIDGSYHEVGKGGVELKLEKAKITLNDCLACSGCVTSAETVLIAQQSQLELYHALEENQRLRKAGLDKECRTIVVSMSPQSRASLAAKYKMTNEDMMAKATSFFKTLGVHYVFDTTFARDFSLLESAKEFVSRFKEGGTLPMLASACPGWVCYAEKTHGSYILPFISTTKSEQQIMGSLVKSYFAEKTLGMTADKIYHVTVMPCYDKKLEASRDDFYSDLYSTRDVDCVLTSGEVDLMFSEKNIDIASLEPSEPDIPFSCYTDSSLLTGHSGGGSGGYLEYILKHSAKEIFGTEVGKIEYKVLRNSDFKEVTLEQDGKVVLKFAAAYGFRNIQNVVQKLKRRKCDYHFVEVMACPSGCLNGGGQIRAEGQEDARLLLQQVEAIYGTLVPQSPEDNLSTLEMQKTWLNDPQSRLKHLHTQYHAIEKESSALTIKW